MPEPQARPAIHELLALYGRVIDDRRWSDPQAVFAADVVYDATDLEQGSTAGSRYCGGWRRWPARTSSPVRRRATDGSEMTGSIDLAGRVARLEAQQEITQLPIRYALAVDQRDIDTWVSLFVPDLDMGRHGSGREVLKDWITPQVATFYRSVHLVCGHRVELGPVGPDGVADTATGAVYCRAEHEIGDRWVVMAIRYDDVYRRVDGTWLFERRKESHWYKADVTERPPEVDFDSWHNEDQPAALPQRESSWAAFWAGRDLAAVTSRPAEPTGGRRV